ncbi:hypothetical protein VIBNIFTn2_120002 [Vibrio nigripulchritudo FTn2]|nr:hypothetical protein VIBNIFTn2_120002 [Vibrio nigripulchritudo FTn2]
MTFLYSTTIHKTNINLFIIYAKNHFSDNGRENKYALSVNIKCGAFSKCQSNVHNFTGLI